ncbi:peptidyl-prolyl cis-trans isomerase FKBP8-like [Stegodyphus dumicola]|uniref:peptidyl-prolyl cis-trans isomerase FKBP8-like n=1 Tax=Stegodyphus dumicola TaxID=202533 RepID=UPI0015A87FCE|nr:peptidyl-prolyl cis-trans isomerase FKBP8-like [Stegodyphus dumicola]
MTAVESLRELGTGLHADDFSAEKNMENIGANLTESIGISSDIHENANSSESVAISETSDAAQSSEQENLVNQDLVSNSSVKLDTPNDCESKSDEDEWLDIMGNGNFKKKVIKKGLGHETRPSRGDRVTVHVSYYLNGELFEESNDLKFIVGDLDVIQGLDLVICLMEKGEKARVVIPSKLAYGEIGRTPDVPPNSDIECDLELKEVESIEEDSLTVSERLKLGNEKRIRGNFFYDRGQYIDSIHCYERAAEYLDGVRDCSGISTEQSQEIVDIRIKVYNNLAASHLKLSAYNSALKSVESVLKVQPKNVKALFRKAKILANQGLLTEAISCLNTAAALEPETKVSLFFILNSSDLNHIRP